jgi:hypothetical protein
VKGVANEAIATIGIVLGILAVCWIAAQVAKKEGLAQVFGGCFLAAFIISAAYCVVEATIGVGRMTSLYLLLAVAALSGLLIAYIANNRR